MGLGCVDRRADWRVEKRVGERGVGRGGRGMRIGDGGVVGGMVCGSSEL